jgi:hypothetical protein
LLWYPARCLTTATAVGELFFISINGPEIQ